MEKKLLRNEHDKVIAGVCSGLAEYMQVDVTIIRLLFVLSAFFLAGGGIVVYFAMWIVVPVNNDINAKFSKFNQFYQQNNVGDMYNGANAFNNPSQNSNQTKWNTENAQEHPLGQADFSRFERKDSNGRAIGGAILLILGVFFLMHSLGFMPFWFNIFKLYKLWPLALIAIGASLILKNKQKKEWQQFNQTFAEQKKTETSDEPVEPKAQQGADDKNEPTV